MKRLTVKGGRRRWGPRIPAMFAAAAMAPLGICAVAWSPASAASAGGGLVSQEPHWRSGASPAPAGSNWRIAVVPKSVGFFYWGSVEAGAQAAGRYFHVKIIWKGTASETDVVAQKNMLQDFINGHVSGLAFAATDAHGLVPIANSALKAGIPVVSIDSGLSPQGPPLVASDNVVAAAKAADILAKQIGYKGQVAFLPFVPTAATSIERTQGFEQEIKKYPHIKVVAVQYDESDVATALSVTENILTSHPQLKGIFDANEPGVDGTVAALAERGLPPGTIKVVGFDNAPDEVNDLADGYVSALIVQDPFRIGYQGAAEVVALLEHKTVPHIVDSGTVAATKANMNQPYINQLLHPPAIAP